MDTFFIEYEFTENDYIKAIEKDIEKTKYLVWLMPILGVLAMFSILGYLSIFEFIGDLSLQIRIIYWIALLIVAVLLAVLFSRKVRAKRIIKGRIRREEIDSQFFGQFRLELMEEYIEVTNESGKMQREYAGIFEVVEYSGSILIYDGQMQIIVIPSSAFKDDYECMAFFNELKVRISQAKNIGVSRQNVEDNKQDARYVLEYSWDEQGFINAITRANRLMFTTRLGWSTKQIISIIIGFFLIFAGIMYFIKEPAIIVDYDNPYIHLPGILCMAIGIAFFSNLLLIFTPSIKRLCIQRINNGMISRDYFALQALYFKEDRITEFRYSNQFDLMYDRVYCVKYDADGMYLLLKGNRLLVIPNSAFVSKDQKQEMAIYIEKAKKESEKEGLK